MFSIIIPTLNNLDYLRLCINSLKKFKVYSRNYPSCKCWRGWHKRYLENENIKYTFTENNSGICKGMNLAAKKAKNNYILYSHDDFYFCPDWDVILKKKLIK